jgi:hypothetical protein
MKRSRAAALILLVPLVALVGGCQRDQPAVETGVTEEPAAVGGLSPEEIRMQAEPMSPEQAERAGIVDTTIYVEPMSPDDTLMVPDTPRPPAAPSP